MALLNQVDLAFIVDTTGSMGGFIVSAREHMTRMLRALTHDSAVAIELHVGVVEYRDHPPQDTSFVTREYPFTADLDTVQRTIAKLEPNGGGDTPEAVYDGVQAAALLLEWRPHSRRVAVLVGDAPPHGGSSPKGCCTCGLTIEEVSATLESLGIVLHTLALTGGLQQSFSWLAHYTGGSYFAAQQGQSPIDLLGQMLLNEFKELSFDQQVLELCHATPAWSVDALGEALASPRGRISASLSRLGRRNLLPS